MEPGAWWNMPPCYAYQNGICVEKKIRTKTLRERSSAEKCRFLFSSFAGSCLFGFFCFVFLFQGSNLAETELNPRIRHGVPVCPTVYGSTCVCFFICLLGLKQYSLLRRAFYSTTTSKDRPHGKQWP